MKQCDNTAKYAIPWAGKILKQCEDHTQQIMGISQAIGASVQPEATETEEKCTQEVEESED